MKTTIIVLGIIGFCAGITAIDFGWNSYKCSSKWEGSQLKTHWGPISGCRIQKDGYWVPDSAFRATE